MDTSKEYIKMCEKAVEIQELYFSVANGDFVSNENGSTYIIGSYDTGKSSKEQTIVRLVNEYSGGYGIECDAILLTWLPRQDQLQDMVYGEKSSWLKHHRFNAWIEEYAGNSYHITNKASMEQLWLAFVMKEKYQKVWDGENWIAQKGTP